MTHVGNTLPQPIIALEKFLEDDSDVPDGIDAQLTFDGTAGSTNVVVVVRQQDVKRDE
jgi:hypothetical protein